MATQDPTVNYDWDLPANGGSAGAWGNALNAIIGDDATGIDAVVKGVSNVADSALPKAGGTMTGEIEVKTDRYAVTDLASITGAKTVDLATARFFHGTVTGNATFSFTNPPSTGKFMSFVLELTNPGAHTLTWPAAVKWPSASVPAWTASGVDVVAFYSYDAGTTWRGARVQTDSR